MRRSAALMCAALLCFIVACDDDGDTTPAADAALTDAAPDIVSPDPDAAPPTPDAAPIDVMIPDSAPADAAAPDSARVDAAIDAVTSDVAVVDGSPTDAAVVDGSPIDEGLADATPDAAPIPDAEYERDPALVTLNGPCLSTRRFGGFKVESNDAEGYTAIDGVVKDSIVQGQIPEEAQAEGGCVLLRRRRLSCEPTCEPGQTCEMGEPGELGHCVPMPLGQDMGEVTFYGLAQPVTLEALQPGNTYFFTRLPHPGFEPGAVLHVVNVPGYLGPLALYGVGVAPLVPSEETWVLTEGEALQIQWAPPPEGSRAHLFFELNIDQHGLTPLNLVCNLPDTGEATVPITMTDALITAGVTGFPTGRVARRTVDSVSFEERCVDLVVSSVRPIGVEVTGYLPCTRHEDCPSGQCDLLIQQCE